MEIGKTKFEKEHNRVRSQLADDKGGATIVVLSRAII